MAANGTAGCAAKNKNRITSKTPRTNAVGTTMRSAAKPKTNSGSKPNNNARRNVNARISSAQNSNANGNSAASRKISNDARAMNRGVMPNCSDGTRTNSVRNRKGADRTIVVG